MNLFLVAELGQLTGACARDEWAPVEPELFATVGEAADAAREAAEEYPGSVFSVALLGPIVASWRAERTPAMPLTALPADALGLRTDPPLPTRRGIRLVHDQKKRLGEG